MDITNVMSTNMLTIESGATLRAATQRMSERNAGAALVAHPDGGTRPGIITERDVLHAVAAGYDLDKQDGVADNTTWEVVTVMADSSLEQAVEKMRKGPFRHLLVLHGGETLGIVSMRDIALALANS